MGNPGIRRAAVIGIGRFGQALAESLAELGVEVIAMDSDMRRVEAVKEHVALAVQADATVESAMHELEIEKVDLLAVGVGERFEVNVLITSWAAEAGIPRVVTRAGSPLHKRILERVGATRVVFAEQEIGQRLAQSLIHGNVLEFVDLPDDYSLREIELPAAYVGRTLGELHLRREHGLSVLAVRRTSLAEGKSERVVTPLPYGDFLFEAGDLLSVIARNEDFAHLES